MTQPYALYNPATHVAVPREPTQEMMEAMPALPLVPKPANREVIR